MRDDGHKWDAPSDDPDVFSGANLRVTQRRPERQTLVSGVRALNSTTLPLIGWPGEAPSGACALVLRRDRILEVDGPERQDGWDDQAGLAISDMTDGYAVFDLDGPGALDLLQRGAFVNPAKESRSVARMIFGLPALLYRRNRPDRYTLHVGSAHAQTLRKAIVSHVRSM